MQALVLGGGGITGIAWELGIVAGLEEAGIDLRSADVVIGTSAGSAVGAQLRSDASTEELYEAQLADPSGEIGASLGFLTLAQFVLAGARPGDPARARAALGRAALKKATVPEAARRAVFERRLRSGEWPERRLLIVAVDAEDGESKVFDRDSGVPLLDAVSASCAVPLVWPPMTVGGRRYIDGGVRSIANADLAAGCDRVVVIAPVTFSARRSGRISVQLAGLGAGVRSAVVSPDAAARKAIGRNVLDPSRRAAAARAGREQAAAVVDAIRTVWL